MSQHSSNCFIFEASFLLPLPARQADSKMYLCTKFYPSRNPLLQNPRHERKKEGEGGQEDIAPRRKNPPFVEKKLLFVCRSLAR